MKHGLLLTNHKKLSDEHNKTNPCALHGQMTQTEIEHTLLGMRPKMMRIATDFFHNDEDAEDIVQEVYVRMLKRGFQEGDDLEALLIKATKNLCVSVWRRQKLRATEQLACVQEPEERHTADTSLLRQERQEQLEVAIRQLPPSEQRLIRLKSEELSIEEISLQAGIPKRTASAMLSTAKKRLLTILKTNRDD